MDGRADVIVEAGDWSAPTSELGDGDDVLDLRRMTNLEYPKNRYGKATTYLGGCICNGGNDRYFGNRDIGRSSADLGAGNDLAWMVTRERTYANGGPGNDVIHGGSGPDRLYGGDTLRGGVDILYGHAGQDLLAKYGSGRAILNGGPHSDYLSGGLGNDTLIGGGPPFDRGGGDSLHGAGGNDRYIGSAGKDHVVDPWGTSTAFLGAGQDDLVLAKGKRHRINCGPNRDWINIFVRGMRGCEVVSSRRRR
jgi:Ca2+-binding RTX toxin-like protein